MTRRRRSIGAISRERDECVIRVLRIDSDPTNEAIGLRCCVNAGEGHIGRRSIGVRRDEQAPETRRRPENILVAVSLAERYNVAARATLVSAKGGARQ